MLNRDFYAHVGYGKTGSTWLQEVFFSKLRSNEILYLGKTIEDYPNWLLDTLYLDGISFYKNCTKIRREINNTISHNSAKKALFSAESFLNPYCVYTNAKRLKKVLPNAKVIIVLRNPIDLVVSQYKYLIYQYGFFINMTSSLYNRRRLFAPFRNPPIYLRDFFYDEVIQLYEDLFDRVFILKYEDFCENKTKFLDDLSEFLGVSCPDVSDKYDKIVNPNIFDVELEKTRAMNLISIAEREFGDSMKSILEQSMNNLLNESNKFVVDKKIIQHLRDIFRDTSKYYEI